MCLVPTGTAFPVNPCELRGYYVLLCGFILSSHDMEYQAEDSQESSLGSIEILSMRAMLPLPARLVSEISSETLVQSRHACLVSSVFGEVTDRFQPAYSITLIKSITGFDTAAGCLPVDDHNHCTAMQYLLRHELYPSLRGREKL